MSTHDPYLQYKSELIDALISTPDVHLSLAAIRKLRSAPWQWSASLLRKAKTLPPLAYLHVTAPNRMIPGSSTCVVLEVIVSAATVPYAQRTLAHALLNRCRTALSPLEALPDEEADVSSTES